MLKSIVLSVVLATGLALAAQAADAPATDDCMKQAFDLADAAEAKQLPDGALAKLDGMFNELEKHCKALELPQARAQAAKIRTFIDTEK